MVLSWTVSWESFCDSLVDFLRSGGSLGQLLRPSASMAILVPSRLSRSWLHWCEDLHCGMAIMDKLFGSDLLFFRHDLSRPREG